MKNIIELKCFIASPGDTKEERDACEEVFDDINNGIGKCKGFRLSSLRWEKDLYPGVGAYSQEVINSQISDRYDFFIGIMKARFGTPTPAAGSGTEEEFDIAYDKWSRKEIQNIFFYFGNPHASMYDFDLEQLQKVKSFRKRIEKQGVFYMQYEDVDDFKKQLQRNLINYFDKNDPKKLKAKKGSNSSFAKAKTRTYDYRQTWENALSLIYNGRELNTIFSNLSRLKEKNRFPKIIFPQEHAVDQLMRKGPLTENQAKVFALAVRDIGQIPSYYDNYLKNDIELNKQPLWDILKQREESLHGSSDSIEISDDIATYEQIQRLLFHLDFSKARKLVEEWDAKGQFVQSKAMRMAVYPEQRNDALDLLKHTIEKENNPIEKLFEIILANYISCQWPRPYSTDEYWRYGIEGQGDLLESMMSAFHKKELKPKSRGWIGTTTLLGSNHGDYTKSLRILQFIIDTGIYLNMPGTYMFEVGSWYKVFENLYQHFPYPCFFYSIQYDDKDTLRRIGEDFAYCPYLQDFVKDILLKSLEAVVNPDTPPHFKKGILNVTASMYVSVDEDVWYDLFINTVFQEFCAGLSNDNPEMVYNVKFAVVSLRKSNNIKYVLKKLLELYPVNESLVSTIIANNMHLHLLSDVNLDDIDIQFKDYLNRDTLDILDSLNSVHILPTPIKERLIKVVCATPLEDFPKDRASLYQLTSLTCDNYKAIQVVKKCFLSLNIWYCGVLSNTEFGWTEPNYIRLNLLNKKVVWSDEEFEIIRQNIIKNVAAYDKVHKSLHNDTFMKAAQVKYLSALLSYINSLDDNRQELLQEVKSDIERLFVDRTQYEDNIDFLMSEQSADVDYAFGSIYESVLNHGIVSNKSDVDFLIDRAIMKSPVALTRNLRWIKFMVDKKWDEMLQLGYDKKLNKLLSVYADSSSWKMLDLRFAFNYLHSIAVKLNDAQLISDENRELWLKGPFVKKFIINDIN